MSLPRHLCGIALAAIVTASGLLSAPSAKAEDLVDFLWGGSPEYGGGRSVVSFDPSYKPGQIIVSFSDRRLYWIMKPGVALTYPVAIPTGEARWQGVTSVTSKRVNPPWTPTPEMVHNNPRLPRWVPGGHPMNPLGIRAMYLGSSAYRIHGTDAPWTIGQAVSHGCIRMTNEDVLDLYPRIPVGTRVTVTWQQFKTDTISDGGNLPRYTDKDSNPRAAASEPSPSAQSTATAEAQPASSTPASYSYAPYGSGKTEAARRVARQSNPGSIQSLFSWGDEPKQQQEAAASEDPEQNPASRDATKDDDDFAAEPKKPEEQKKVATESDRKVVDKAPKKVREANAEPEHPASHEPSTPKKKADAAPAPKKKPVATAKTSAPADPSSEPLTAVPDPVKPASNAAPAKDTESHTTKASASDGDTAHVQNASLQVR